MGKYFISNPEVLVVHDGSRSYYGANQTWYREEWQRRAGCGPTTAAQMFWYMGKTHEQFENFKTELPITKNNILELMEDVWNYVTPATMGLNSPYIFKDGMEKYAQSLGINLKGEVLFVDTCRCRRPQIEQTADFIAESIAQNLPVAFLNLSNGSLTNLDGWHWVLLTGYNRHTHFATMFDQGRCMNIDILSWLKTTFLGGAFVRVHI